MKYNQNVLSVIFMFIAILAFIAYIVRDIVGTHPIIVLSINLLAILGVFVFINPNEEGCLPMIILLGLTFYFLLLFSVILIEIII